KGWTVDDDQVFVDDGVSGAEYQNRSGFTRLLTRLKEFDALIMSEPSRLGRDMLRNAYHVGEILDAGVRIFYYLTDEEERADTPEQKIMLTLKSYASEVERQKASQRSRDALERKALKGYNTGGRVYGYDNVWAYPDGQKVVATPGEKGDGKAYTEYRVNEVQADIVRRIFRMYADGYGARFIAKTLNGDPDYRDQNRQYFDSQTPPAPWKGTGSWAPSSIRAMLHNVRYTGQIPFGRHRKAYRQGTKKRLKQDEHLLIDAPHLRIIEAELWEAVQQRDKRVNATYLRHTKGQAWGRPKGTRASKYLLPGLMRCAYCGSNMVVTSLTHGTERTRRRVPHYLCSYRHNRGATACANTRKVRLGEVEDKVLAAIEQQVLTPTVVEATIDKAFATLIEEHKQAPERAECIEAEIKQVRQELDNLLRLAAAGRTPESVLSEIVKREQRIEELGQQLATCRIEKPGEAELLQLKQDLRAHVGRFSDLLYCDVTLARQTLRTLLAGPLRFIPVEPKSWRVEGETQLGALLPPTRISMASPRGFEPLLQP
ncbi:MAG: recombinase family protein, partial [Acidiferrobacterales bacterium]